MKSTASIVGILLIIFGLATLGYKGFTYTKEEKVAQIGDLQVTANTEKRVDVPPIVAGLALVAGLVLVVVSRR